jgi:hypothetical protein
MSIANCVLLTLKSDQKHSNSVVLLEDQQARGHGTGFTIRLEGKKYTVSNAHVCVAGLKDRKMFAASFGSARYELDIIKVSKKYDLCLLESFPESKPLHISRRGVTEDRAKVKMYGFPLLPHMTKSHGEFLGYEEVSMPFSWVSVEDCEKSNMEYIHSLFGQSGCLTKQRLWVSNMPIDRGASGSPLLDQHGDVIGVLSIGMGMNAWAGGVPLKELKEFLGVKEPVKVPKKKSRTKRSHRDIRR